MMTEAQNGAEPGKSNSYEPPQFSAPAPAAQNDTRLPVRGSYHNNTGDFGDVNGPRKSGWGFSSIDWRFVFAVQHWATFVWAIIFLICLGIVHWTQKVTTRPFLQYDATISYIAHKDTVSNTTAWIVPFVVLAINLLVLEIFGNRRQNRTISHALALALHFFIDAICCFICMRFIVEISKNSAGRLRPFFLQDCYGSNGLSGTANLAFANGSSRECTSKRSDSRKSLPSGHASSSMVTITYSIAYCLWTVYFRSGTHSFAGLNSRAGFRKSFMSRLWSEFAHTLLMLWLVLQFCFTWATGITRFVDNKHNVSDVVAGWFIGAFFGLLFVSRAIGVSKFILLAQD